jgi:hypothetical protein
VTRVTDRAARAAMRGRLQSDETHEQHRAATSAATATEPLIEIRRALKKIQGENERLELSLGLLSAQLLRRAPNGAPRPGDAAKRRERADSGDDENDAP